ncbi:LacI family transcriptional regulator [Marinilongibacter aquaticus]|uniref:LacI family DNA-binding transcriptional regulator n=1 Tax=Marinilongibacter aquaticus TaxID=2975157 RepID=UPI0021BD0EEC|nr:LacI family DNA-binding transcriptional regulator [Marinilongibacter aquaticus]UBM59344.1 LacI family transcriptional regulator [Marinilongibacter aquaticus]
MDSKKVSIKDIAREAGVSTALVSYVMNGNEKEKRVGKEMAAKIREIAKKLNYQPNQVAKSLRKGRTNTIGLVIADISNPFFANIARVVEDEARRNGYTVIIGSCDERAEKAWDLINVLLNRQVDGFIIVSSEHSEEHITHLRKLNIPFVLLDRHFPELDTDFVATDNFTASFDACEHLIEMGYRKIGLIAYRLEMQHMRDRIRGYQEALKRHKIKARKEWLVEVEFENLTKEVEASIDVFREMKDGPDALIFATYGLAINGLRHFNECNLKVPDDFAIVSFGQAEIFELYYCPITYMLQPLENLGAKAVEVLLQKINDKKTPLTQILMKAKLIQNESSRSKLAVS